MTEYRTQRDEVEEILSLVPGATAADADALVALFADASGPARLGELPGEAAALAAFRDAQPLPVVPSRNGKLMAAALTVKTAVAALVLTSVGGVALAATTGVLPAPLTPSSHSKDKPKDDTDRVPAVDDASNAAAVQEAAKSAVASDLADAKAGRERSYAGLCTAFTAGAWDNGKAATNPAFARLVAAAPDGNVSAFCSALTTEAAATKVPPGRTKSAEAKGKPSDNGKSAEAKEKATGKGKSADAREKAAGRKAKAPAARDSGTAPGRGNSEAARVDGVRAT